MPVTVASLTDGRLAAQSSPLQLVPSGGAPQIDQTTDRGVAETAAAAPRAP